MRKVLLVICTTILPVALIVSCSKSGSDNDDDSNVTNCNGISKTFATDVNPIIQSFCNQSDCHAPGSTNGPGQLTNYTEVFSARNVIREAIRTGLMPKNTTLSAAQKNAIICWIDSGAPNN